MRSPVSRTRLPGHGHARVARATLAWLGEQSRPGAAPRGHIAQGHPGAGQLPGVFLHTVQPLPAQPIRLPEYLPGPCRTRGIGMIEVLISMLILSVGVLAIAALQFKGMQYNQDALFRSQISLLAYDLTDRMRMNPDNAADYVTGIGTWKVPVAGTRERCAVLSAADARVDVSCWKNQLIDALPGGSTARLRGSNPYTLTLRWKDREGSRHDIDYTFQL